MCRVTAVVRCTSTTARWRWLALYRGAKAVQNPIIQECTLASTDMAPGFDQTLKTRATARSCANRFKLYLFIYSEN